MKTYEYGLRNCDDTPQEYKLSHILAGYKQGFHKSHSDLMQIGIADSTIKSDGSLDFSVPRRYYSPPQLLSNLRLAWKVLTGKASILYYE